MSSQGDEEFPPLWPPGLHPSTLEELQDRCVDAFKLSKTRANLMASFRTLAEILASAGVKCTLWLNGSFVTEKIDPSDIDFVAVVDSRLYDAGTAEQKQILDGLVDGELWKAPFLCDTNVAYVDPPEYAGSSDVLAYWRRRFGFSRLHQTPKGIVTFEIIGMVTAEADTTNEGHSS
jgi:hypothetical protein